MNKSWILFWHGSIFKLARIGWKELICSQAQMQFHSGPVSGETGIPKEHTTWRADELHSSSTKRGRRMLQREK